MRSWAAWVAGFLFAAGLASEVHAQKSSTADVPMRDGAKLRTTIWLPGTGAYPAVLTRGYKPDGLGGFASFWTKNGYAFVSQQCRGEGGDDGSRFFPDDKDGYDCIQWIASQPWCNGKVAMWGGSYWGATQWRAAVAQPPALKAIVPACIDAELWKTAYRRNGAIHLKMTSQGRVTTGNYSLDEWKRVLSYLPLIDLDRHVRSAENKLWRDYVTHSSFDDYWKPIGMRDGNKWSRINIPVYCVSGWRDYYAGSALENYHALKAAGHASDARVRIGDHGHTGAPDLADSLRFLDWHLKGAATAIQEEPPIKIEVRHGSWTFADRWPLAGTRFTKVHLTSPEGSRFGSLAVEPPAGESPSRYVYDPRDPVLTLGANGSHIYPEVPGLITDDPVDQRPNEGRADVLVHTGEPLAQDVTVIGPVEARLYAATSAKDTDFVVRLIDVYPDGRALNVTEGIVRARYRNSIWEEPSLVAPGQTCEYRIELLPAAIVFKKGHRIRLHVSSSCWPLWDRNQNTGNPIGMDAEVEVAQQTIYHDRKHPSHVLLPVVSGELPADAPLPRPLRDPK